MKAETPSLNLLARARVIGPVGNSKGSLVALVGSLASAVSEWKNWSHLRVPKIESRAKKTSTRSKSVLPAKAASLLPMKMRGDQHCQWTSTRKKRCLRFPKPPPNEDERRPTLSMDISKAKKLHSMTEGQSFVANIRRGIHLSRPTILMSST
ncbi:hypothetical protein GOBAR_DD02170 [Gossypium barbadense]|nr:hypothetical protein GOBAR_DD02170 [Gossypium barbadense]